jgi:hypothetical protein
METEEERLTPFSGAAPVFGHETEWGAATVQAAVFPGSELVATGDQKRSNS